MNRTAGTILREIAQTNAAKIDPDIKQNILDELQNELRAMYAHKAKQPQLPGVDQIPADKPAKRA